MSWSDALERDTVENTKFRKVINTGSQMQVVAMSIPKTKVVNGKRVLGEIGMETHPETSQFIYITQGTGYAITKLPKEKRVRIKLKKGTGLLIEPGTQHNIVNSSKTRPLKLFTVYSDKMH